MPCKVIQLPGGVTAIVRMPKDRARRCSVCKQKVHDYVLCDFIERPGYTAESPDGMTAAIPDKTCDVVCCKQHAVHVDPDRDYCLLHAAALQIGGRRLRL